jgi:hypothetical protein
MSAQDKPPEPPGAVPRDLAAQQVTAPLPTGQQPFAYPHFQQSAPVVDVRRAAGQGMDIAKMLGVVVTICTIIFSAGAANEKLKQLEANQRAFVEQQRQHNRLQDDRSEKSSSAVTDLTQQVRELTEQLKRLRVTRPRRRAEPDQPLPLGP